MNKLIKEFADQAGFILENDNLYASDCFDPVNNEIKLLSELIIKECINKIETYRIYVGNSPAGELACEWTYDALLSIREDIKETFGITDND